MLFQVKKCVARTSPETWNLEPGTWNLEPGTWNLEPGTWNLEPVNGHKISVFAVYIVLTKVNI